MKKSCRLSWSSRDPAGSDPHTRGWNFRGDQIVEKPLEEEKESSPSKSRKASPAIVQMAFRGASKIVEDDWSARNR